MVHEAETRAAASARGGGRTGGGRSSRGEDRRPAEQAVEDTDEEYDACSGRFEVREDASEAHRQVMEMSATIEILTRDFENLQRELLDAYKKLQDYSEQDPRLHPNRPSPSKVGTTMGGGIVSNAIAKLRSGNYGECGCGHEGEVHQLQQLITVKDTALTEALHERNEYKLQLERTEAVLHELQLSSSNTRAGASRSRSGLHIQTSSRTASFSGASIPYGMTSTSPVSFTPSVAMSSAASVASATSSRDVPKHERFDQESSYQSREDDELFWRRQYRDAVRMRKHHGQPSMPISQGNSGGGSSGGGNASGTRPSLKIFSYPNANRHKGITDENVPFTRYIGISTRQNEIIKEQHRLLS